MVEHYANMPNVDALNEMEHVSQVMHHVANVLDDVSKVENHHFLCFGGCGPFPIGDTNVHESIKGGVNLEVFTNMETSIQVSRHHNLG
jgi:hypothetical protein